VSERIKIDGKRMRMPEGAERQALDDTLEAAARENAEWFQLGVTEGEENVMEELAEMWEGCATIDEMGQAFHNYMIQEHGIDRWTSAREESK